MGKTENYTPRRVSKDNRIIFIHRSLSSLADPRVANVELGEHFVVEDSGLMYYKDFDGQIYRQTDKVLNRITIDSLRSINTNNNHFEINIDGRGELPQASRSDGSFSSMPTRRFLTNGSYVEIKFNIDIVRDYRFSSIINSISSTNVLINSDGGDLTSPFDLRNRQIRSNSDSSATYFNPDVKISFNNRTYDVVIGKYSFNRAETSRAHLPGLTAQNTLDDYYKNSRTLKAKSIIHFYDQLSDNKGFDVFTLRLLFENDVFYVVDPLIIHRQMEFDKLHETELHGTNYKSRYASSTGRFILSSLNPDGFDYNVHPFDNHSSITASNATYYDAGNTELAKSYLYDGRARNVIDNFLFQYRRNKDFSLIPKNTKDPNTTLTAVPHLRVKVSPTLFLDTIGFAEKPMIVNLATVVTGINDRGEPITTDRYPTFLTEEDVGNVLLPIIKSLINTTNKGDKVDYSGEKGVNQLIRDIEQSTTQTVKISNNGIVFPNVRLAHNGYIPDDSLQGENINSEGLIHVANSNSNRFTTTSYDHPNRGNLITLNSANAIVQKLPVGFSLVADQISSYGTGIVNTSDPYDYGSSQYGKLTAENLDYFFTYENLGFKILEQRPLFNNIFFNTSSDHRIRNNVNNLYSDYLRMYFGSTDNIVLTTKDIGNGRVLSSHSPVNFFVYNAEDNATIKRNLVSGVGSGVLQQSSKGSPGLIRYFNNFEVTVGSIILKNSFLQSHAWLSGKREVSLKENTKQIRYSINLFTDYIYSSDYERNLKHPRLFSSINGYGGPESLIFHGSNLSVGDGNQIFVGTIDNFGQDFIRNNQFDPRRGYPMMAFATYSSYNGRNRTPLDNNTAGNNTKIYELVPSIRFLNEHWLFKESFNGRSNKYVVTLERNKYVTIECTIPVSAFSKRIVSGQTFFEYNFRDNLNELPGDINASIHTNNDGFELPVLSESMTFNINSSYRNLTAYKEIAEVKGFMQEFSYNNRTLSGKVIVYHPTNSSYSLNSNMYINYSVTIDLSRGGSRVGPFSLYGFNPSSYD